MVRILIAVLLLIAGTAGSRAATAFFYSDEDEYYGWGAGFSTFSRAESEARAGCIAGGKKCQFALECGNGYAAVAFADDSAHGAAFVCGASSAAGARVVAIAACMNVSRTMCWTSTALDPRGNEYSEAQNDEFDRTYLGQQMLFAAGFDPGGTDGEMGPATRRQLLAFEQKYGLPAETDFKLDVIWRLLNVMGGPQTLADGLFKAVIDPEGSDYKNNVYAVATQPAPERDYSREMATYDRDEQLKGLAMILTENDRFCTVPAKSVEPVPADGSGAWNIQCDEGDFTLFFGSGSTMVTSGLSDITVAADGSVTARPRDGDGGNVTIDGGSVTIGGDDGGGDNGGATEAPQPPAGGTGRTLGH